MIQLTVTDTLQNFTNDYIFVTQNDMVAAVNMLLELGGYSQETAAEKSTAVDNVNQSFNELL
jgi:hypothetical protein